MRLLVFAVCAALAASASRIAPVAPMLARGASRAPRSAVCLATREVPPADTAGLDRGERARHTQQKHSRWGAPERIALDAPGVTTPTERGSTVDAKRLVDQGDVAAMWLSHILVDTQEMAELVLQQVRGGQAFDEVAKGVSACEGTREAGGAIGWVNREGDEPHVDEILSPGAQGTAFAHKPGDLFVATTDRGVHVVRVDDVMMRLRKDTIGRQRLRGSGSDLLPLVDAWRARAGLAADTGVAGTDTSPALEEAGLTYEVVSMGCQMNAADSERMAGSLEALGFRPAPEASVGKGRADVVVVNTCSIRDHAEQKVYSTLGPYAARKRRGDPVGIVVAGCVAQQEGARLLRRVPEVDVVMGPQYANRLGDLLEDALNGNQVVATEPTFIMEDVTKPRRGSSVCAWVNVIYGCNERCTYCVVPGTRGVEQSRPLESIRAEMEELADQGFKEVTLLGQNIDAYGRDMKPKRKFADLLAHVADVPGIERVRFVTSHPRYMSDSVVSTVAAHPKLMPVFHIPAQSGDDEVLNNMGRGYTAERYLQIVDRIRSAVPDASITSDFIVGTPGETEEQFQATLDLMEQVRFDASMTAAYSPRPNTPMALWENQLSDEVKEDRLHRINRVVKKHALERSQRFVGRVEQVLVEMRNLKRPEQVAGRTESNRLVFFEGDIEELRGMMVPVRITEAREFSLTGELVS